MLINVGCLAYDFWLYCFSQLAHVRLTSLFYAQAILYSYAIYSMRRCRAAVHLIRPKSLLGLLILLLAACTDVFSPPGVVITEGVIAEITIAEDAICYQGTPDKSSRKTSSRDRPKNTLNGSGRPRGEEI